MEILASNTILYCKDWQAMVTFYKEVMGFRQSFRKDDWFMELVVNDGSHLSVADEAKCSVKATSGQGITLSFKVARLTEVHRQLEEQGVKPTPIKSHSWRAPYFFIHDPEGNRIELWNFTAD
jgi:catechol 2,3-dioxygenase-like lactoylglutathione lyase family enzyme